MKKIFLTLMLLPFVYLANGQDYKLFINDSGRPANAFNATSYIVVKQLAGTAWFMQQYGMENVILQSGSFKDKNLQISNGKFVYYRKLNFYNNKKMKEWLKSDTVNRIMTEGSFEDGKKDGQWTDYFIGGQKREEVYYKSGVLNEPYNSYNSDHSTVGLSGNYVDGKREGEWKMFGLDGKVMETDKYRNGKMSGKKMTLGPYNPPKPPHGFEGYIASAFRKVMKTQNVENLTIKYSIVFTVTADGRILRPEINPVGHDDDPLARAIAGIIESSPQWKPANTGDETKPVEDFSVISIDINKGVITTKTLDYAQYKAAYYYLNH